MDQNGLYVIDALRLHYYYMAVGPDEISSHALELYSSLAFSPPPGQFTVVASLVLASSLALKSISLATGSKCLPAMRLPNQGDALHDSHAEILARRAAIRWLLEEITRSVAGSSSQWIERQHDGRYALQNGVHMHMYISTPPCMDNSVRGK
jgi:tRNA-specific adenosine deaminase 1